ncbi:hypothetical protein sos41_24670 [Alphaproteobacteria bacterium SO-S41]|nr:hypothetical protein sos41_24670 [Alphaproteobacteria bacterium SO-S41]
MDDEDLEPAAPALPVEATPKERAAEMLLQAAYEVSPLALFEQADRFAGSEAERLQRAKAGADLLVGAKMARFTGDDRTEIDLTNAGRYWALHGGYLAFLKEEPPSGAGGGGRGRNPELEAMRMTLTKMRLQTYWWSFGMSLAGFIFSLISIAMTLWLGHSLK